MAIDTKFWTFDQNNSGGSFHYDAKAGIGSAVAIEAIDAAHALARAEAIGIYFNGCDDGRDCECCGDRWSDCLDEGTEQPTKYGAELTGGWGIPAYVHYLDGRIEARGMEGDA